MSQWLPSDLSDDDFTCIPGNRQKVFFAGGRDAEETFPMGKTKIFLCCGSFSGKEGWPANSGI